jgi:hypothetical protein
VNALVLRTPWRDLSDEVLDVMCDLVLDAPPSTDLLDQPELLFAGHAGDVEMLALADETPAHVSVDVAWDAWDRWLYSVGAFNEGDDLYCASMLDCCDGSGCSHCD